MTEDKINQKIETATRIADAVQKISEEAAAHSIQELQRKMIELAEAHPQFCQEMKLQVASSAFMEATILSGKCFLKVQADHGVNVKEASEYFAQGLDYMQETIKMEVQKTLSDIIGPDKVNKMKEGLDS